MTQRRQKQAQQLESNECNLSTKLTLDNNCNVASDENNSVLIKKTLTEVREDATNNSSSLDSVVTCLDMTKIDHHPSLDWNKQQQQNTTTESDDVVYSASNNNTSSRLPPIKIKQLVEHNNNSLKTNNFNNKPISAAAAIKKMDRQSILSNSNTVHISPIQGVKSEFRLNSQLHQNQSIKKLDRHQSTSSSMFIDDADDDNDIVHDNDDDKSSTTTSTSSSNTNNRNEIVRATDEKRQSFQLKTTNKATIENKNDQQQHVNKRKLFSLLGGNASGTKASSKGSMVKDDSIKSTTTTDTKRDNRISRAEKWCWCHNSDYPTTSSKSYLQHHFSASSTNNNLGSGSQREPLMGSHQLLDHQEAKQPDGKAPPSVGGGGGEYTEASHIEPSGRHHFHSNLNQHYPAYHHNNYSGANQFQSQQKIWPQQQTQHEMPVDANMTPNGNIHLGVPPLHHHQSHPPQFTGSFWDIYNNFNNSKTRTAYFILKTVILVLLTLLLLVLLFSIGMAIHYVPIKIDKFINEPHHLNVTVNG